MTDITAELAFALQRTIEATGLPIDFWTIATALTTAEQILPGPLRDPAAWTALQLF